MRGRSPGNVLRGVGWGVGMLNSSPAHSTPRAPQVLTTTDVPGRGPVSPKSRVTPVCVIGISSALCQYTEYSVCDRAGGDRCRLFCHVSGCLKSDCSCLYGPKPHICLHSTLSMSANVADDSVWLVSLLLAASLWTVVFGGDQVTPQVGDTAEGRPRSPWLSVALLLCKRDPKPR